MCLRWKHLHVCNVWKQGEKQVEIKDCLFFYKIKSYRPSLKIIYVNSHQNLFAFPLGVCLIFVLHIKVAIHMTSQVKQWFNLMLNFDIKECMIFISCEDIQCLCAAKQIKYKQGSNLGKVKMFFLSQCHFSKLKAHQYIAVIHLNFESLVLFCHIWSDYDYLRSLEVLMYILMSR